MDDYRTFDTLPKKIIGIPASGKVINPNTDSYIMVKLIRPTVAKIVNATSNR